MSKSLTFKVFVTPNAKQASVSLLSEEEIEIRVTAQPNKGKANKEIITSLSKILGLKKKSISIVSGLKSRIKIIQIEGMSLEEVESKIF